MEYFAKKVSFITPKDKLLLQGLWLGSFSPKRLFVYVHGLSGSMFGREDLCTLLATKGDAVLMFNNRGFGVLNGFKSKKGKGEYKLFGAAHEVFTDCVDDIDGALLYAKKYKPKEIVLVGHSTGCQKSIYWAYKKKNHGLVKNIILLAPMSDYAGTPERLGKSTYQKLLKEAQTLVQKGKKHALLAQTDEKWTIDAQRFLSLYAPKSVEEIFSYANPKQKAKIFSSVQLPLHIVFAEKDEWMDRPIEEILEWFEKNNRSKNALFSIIKGAEHSFSGKEKVVYSHIQKFLQ